MEFTTFLQSLRGDEFYSDKYKRVEENFQRFLECYFKQYGWQDDTVDLMEQATEMMENEEDELEG